MAEYLTFLRQHFATDRVDDGATLLEMIRHNASSALDSGMPAKLEPWLDTTMLTAPLVAVDGRMLPHEWIRHDANWFKVDALDHHADDFLPGCRDIAWDLAGACVECGFGDESGERLVREYERRSGDLTIAERLPFFTVAYLAYRVGYATLAAESLARTADGARFSRLRERYRRLLAGYAGRRRPSAGR